MITKLLNHQKLIKRYFSYVGVITLMIFIISSNKAWLYHDDKPIDKIPEKIPFMWQYDTDAAGWLYRGADLPLYLSDKLQPNIASTRPLFPLLVFLFTKTFGLFLKYMFSLNAFQLAAIGYIILKLCLYTISGILMVHTIKKHTNESVALLAVALLFFHRTSMMSISTFHNYELEFLTPIIVVSLFQLLCDSYSTKKNILYSVIVGILMLGRPNYAVYLAVLGFVISRRFYKKAVFSCVIQFVPLLIWILFLKVFGISYTQWSLSETAEFRSQLLQSHPIEIIQVFISHWRMYIQNISIFYGIWIFLAAFGLAIFKSPFKHHILNFSIIFLGTTWFQAFIVFQYKMKTRMMADLSILVFGFAAYMVYYLIRRLTSKSQKRIVMGILVGWLFINVIMWVRIPWIHPFDQKGLYREVPSQYK